MVVSETCQNFKNGALGCGGGGNCISVRRGKKYLLLGRLEQLMQNESLLYRQYKPNEPTKKGPHSVVLVVSPFNSVSTVSRGHPSLVSLVVSERLSIDMRHAGSTDYYMRCSVCTHHIVYTIEIDTLE